MACVSKNSVILFFTTDRFWDKFDFTANEAGGADSAQQTPATNIQAATKLIRAALTSKCLLTTFILNPMGNGKFSICILRRQRHSKTMKRARFNLLLAKLKTCF